MYHVEKHQTGSFIIHSPTGEKMHELPLDMPTATKMAGKLNTQASKEINANIKNKSDYMRKP